MQNLLTIKEASEVLSVSISTLYTWVNQKRIPYLKLGSAIRFDLNDIHKWLENKRIQQINYEI